MAEGTIKRLTDKGFGFIETPDSDQDMFFHMSACNGCEFDQLNEGQRVSFDVGSGPERTSRRERPTGVALASHKISAGFSDPALFFVRSLVAVPQKHPIVTAPIPQPTILDVAATDLGTFYLSRRQSPATDADVYEILIEGEVLMSSLDPVSERRLSTSATSMHPGAGPLRVLVGGLGLGYTAEAALEDPRVTSVRVVEKMDFVIDWMAQGQLPLSSLFQADERVQVVQGDVYAVLQREPTERYDLILVDVDHAPDDPLGGESAAFYSVEGQRAVARHLLPGGILGVWSAVSEEGFSRVLAEVYSTTRDEEVHWQDIELPEADFQNQLFFARVD